MVHHRFDLEAGEEAIGIQRQSGGGPEGVLDKMSRALQIPPTEVFEIITQHRWVLSLRGLSLACVGGRISRLLKFQRWRACSRHAPLPNAVVCCVHGPFAHPPVPADFVGWMES